MVDPEKDPPNERDGEPQGNTAGSREPGGAPKPADAPKPPPWQVPKPELRPELRHPEETGGPRDSEFPPPGPVFDPLAREREREREREAGARKKRSQRRTVAVGLGVTALLAGTITAIVASNEQDADYAQVCFNEETGERVEDTQCNSSAGRGGAFYAWYFYARGATVPAVGQNRAAYPDFTRTVPQGAKTSTGYSTKGGTVSRGGFGSSSKGGSTGG
jgi:hypothetical protein